MEQLPYELQVRYGEPTVHATAADVRTALTKYADNLMTQAERIGGTEDREQIALLREAISRVTDGCKLPMSFDFVVGSYTGTRFQATVRDRRQG